MTEKFGDIEPSKFAGERLGLPEEGRGSVARVGRRFGALAIDWAIAALPAYLLIKSEHPELWNLLFFGVMQVIFIPTIGGSVGHRLLGMQVVPIAGGWVGIWRPLIRTVLLILVIPVLVWDSDQRGFHDKIAGTVLIRA